MGSNMQVKNAGFTFEPLFQPDTNVICFIAIPMRWEQGKLRKISFDLKVLNNLNREIFNQLSIKSEGKVHKMPYAQDFFVSKTIFRQDQYRYKSIQIMLKRFGIRKKEYQQEGLFVLRSTVMNPWYYLAEQTGVNYLKKFVRYLHRITRDVIDKK